MITGAPYNVNQHQNVSCEGAKRSTQIGRVVAAERKLCVFTWKVLLYP